MAGGILTRSTGLAATLLVIASAFLPMRPLAMQLKIVGNQIILSGPVVWDEPGKIREALANTPGIDTVILRNSQEETRRPAIRLGNCFENTVTYGSVRLLLFLVLEDVSRRQHSLLHR
jgi:hypothetical protein